MAFIALGTVQSPRLGPSPRFPRRLWLRVRQPEPPRASAAPGGFGGEAPISKMQERVALQEPVRAA